MKKKKNANPSEVNDVTTKDPSRNVTTTTSTSVVEPRNEGGQNYLVEESNDSQLASEQQGSSGAVSKSYLVSTPSSDEDGEQKYAMHDGYFQAYEPYRATSQGGTHDVEIVSVHDDTSEYTEEYEVVFVTITFTCTMRPCHHTHSVLCFSFSLQSVQRALVAMIS